MFTIQEFIVSPNHRGKGYGSAILKELLNCSNDIIGQDISIAEAKQKGIQPKDCSEKKYIGIKFDITYDEFMRRNKSIKKDEHDFEKVRIEDVDFAHNKCKWVSQVRNHSEVCYIDDFLNAFNNGYFKISNPSALTNWKYWKE